MSVRELAIGDSQDTVNDGRNAAASIDELLEPKDLTAAEQQRLIDILDAYMIDVEEGRGVDRQQLLAENADIADLLNQYFDSLELVRCVAAGDQSTTVPDFSSTVNLHERNKQPVIFQALPSSTQRLGQYALGPVIGRGAMGIVYIARDLRLERDVAVKVLSYGTALDETRIDRFRREAKTAASLDHPNVVPVYSVGCSRSTHYYAMQLIDGESLDRRIAAARLLDGEQYPADQLAALQRAAAPIIGPDRYRRIAQFCASAAGALHAAHTAGIIHRDVKPSNLLLGYDGQLWVTDFGLARVQTEAGLTRTGELVGTVRYMSPEQARGQGDLIDARTDVYALGATLYELVTLKNAYAGEDTLSLLQAIQNQEPTAPRAYDSQLPRDLETIILRAMRPHSADRYRTAAAMADDLQRFVEGKPISASSLSLSERLIGWVRRHKNLASSLVAMWFILMIASFATTILVTREHRNTVAALNAAEAHFNDARQAVDALGEVSIRLLPISEAASIRQELLAETMGYYQRFIASSVEDPNLIQDVALTRLEMARLTSVTGSYADAERAYQAAVYDLTRASTQSGGAPRPGSAAVGLALVRALNEWALLASSHGDQATAEMHLNNALGLFEQLDWHSAGLQQQAQLARALTHNNRGVVHLRAGAPREGKLQLEQSIELLNALSLTDMDESLASDHNPRLNSDLTSELADAFSNASVMFAENQEFTEAAAAAEQSIRLRSHRMQTAEDNERAMNAEQLSRLAITHNNLASLHWRAGKVDGAIAAYRNAISLLEKAVQRAPGHTTPRDRLAVTLNNLGMALVSAGNLSEAESVLTRAASLAQPAYDADPSDAEAAKRLGGICNNLAVLLRDRGRAMEANELLQNAMKLVQDAADNTPFDAGKQQALHQIQSNLQSLNQSD